MPQPRGRNTKCHKKVNAYHAHRTVRQSNSKDAPCHHGPSQFKTDGTHASSTTQAPPCERLTNHLSGLSAHASVKDCRESSRLFRSNTFARLPTGAVKQSTAVHLSWLTESAA